VRIYTIVVVLFTLAFSLLSGFILPRDVSPVMPLILIAALVVIGSVIATFSGILEGWMHEFMSREFRRAGYTMPPKPAG
jgi:ABC-type dipeptide/oligopeptide/nickel transport system permease subunit